MARDDHPAPTRRSEPHLRNARMEDVDAMARVQLAGWRAGFAGIVPPDLDPALEHLADRFTERLNDPSSLRAVVEIEGEVRALCASGPSRDARADPGVGEIYVLFVHPCAWRRGLGKALVARALAGLAANGFGEVTVWSFADNAGANAFYERHGFHRDGAEQRRPEIGPALIVRYRRALT